MRNLFYLGFVAVILSAFVGCATTATRMDQVKDVPTSELFAYQVNDEDHNSQITVIRDQGFIGSGCYIYLTIDGVLAGKFNVGEVANFYLSPGEHLLKVSQDGKGLCAINKEWWTQRETILKPDEKKTFRLTIGSDGQYDIMRYE